MKKERLHQLYMILASSHEWHMASDLAFKLHTSTRTINNYVNEINRTSEDGVLIESSFRGYRWSNRSFRKETAAPSDTEYAPSDRYWYILRKIILERPSYDQLLDDLFISESTIDNDLQKVRALARQHGVRLRNVRGRLFLNGRRNDIRRLSYLCVMNHYTNTNLTIPVIKQAFPMYDCDTLYDILIDTLHRHSFKTNAYAQKALFLLVMLQYWDVMHGTFMNESESLVTDLHEHEEFRIAVDMAGQFLAVTGADYNPWELEYLAGLLVSMADSISGEASLFTGYEDLPDNTVLNLRNASTALGVDLTDTSIVNKTVNYMQRLIIRNKMGLVIKDPVCSSLKISHPVFQDVSAWILIFTARQYDIAIDTNEVGFLNQYLCGLMKEHGYPFDLTVSATLVCPSFGDYPDALIDSLTTRLGDSVDLHRIVDHIDAAGQGSDQNELFMSVVPISGLRHYVNISLYPRAADFRHIYTELHRIKMKAYCEELAALMEDLLCPEIVVSTPNDSDVSLILDGICTELLEMGYVKKGFSDDISERESMDASVYHSNILIPHVYGTNINRNFIQIALFPKPAIYEDTRINILCVIGIAEGNASDLYKIYDRCIKVFSSQYNTNAILRAYDRTSLIDILRTIDIT